MSAAIFFGSNSDIAKALVPHFLADAWELDFWHRGSDIGELRPWDLAVFFVGQVGPVGHWWEQDSTEWEGSVEANILLPVRLLRMVWAKRNPNAAVCFMSGSNPNKPMAGYSAYNAGKMALLKVCEQLDVESPDCRFFALGPGYIPTKIHRPTLKAGWKNEVIERGTQKNSMADVYDCLKWCLSQPQEVIGGRNICVSDHPRGPSLSERLRSNPSLYKLRRKE